MGPDHGVDRCRVGDTVFNRTTVGVAAPVDVLGAVAGGQATEPGPDIRLETRVGGLHVGEQGVTAAAFGQHVDLEHGDRRGLLGTRDVGVPAVSVGDRGVAMGADQEHRRIVVFGRGRRVLVQRAQSSGERHLDVGHHRCLVFEQQDAVVEEGGVQHSEHDIVDAASQVDAPDLSAQDRRDRRDLQLGHRACSSAHRSASVPQQGPTCRIPTPEG